MSKLAYQVWRLWLSVAMREALDQHVGDDRKVSPGQLRKRGEWYWLAYLKVVKVKTWDLPLWDLAANEVNTVRCFGFHLAELKESEARDGSKAPPGYQYALLVHGSASEVREVCGLLDALALQLSASSKETTVNYAEYYRLDTVDVDLGARLAACEAAGLVADVRSIKVTDLEVRLGKCKPVTILTDDYGAVKKVLAEVGAKVTALEIQLKVPEKTWLTLGADGAVKVLSRASGTDFDFEDLLRQEALKGARLVPLEIPNRQKPRTKTKAELAKAAG